MAAKNEIRFAPQTGELDLEGAQRRYRAHLLGKQPANADWAFPPEITVNGDLFEKEREVASKQETRLRVHCVERSTFVFGGNHQLQFRRCDVAMLAFQKTSCSAVQIDNRHAGVVPINLAYRMNRFDLLEVAAFEIDVKNIAPIGIEIVVSWSGELATDEEMAALATRR